MRHRPIVTLGPAVAVAGLLMIGSALGGARATPASWNVVSPAPGGPAAGHGTMVEPRELAVGTQVGRVPRDLNGALEGVLSPGTPVLGTPDNSPSAGQAGSGRSRIPLP